MTTQPPVRERILASATQLFDAASLRSISADKVIAGAGTTKATFYRHFPTKDDLVVAYLDVQLAHLQSAVEEQRVASDDGGALLKWLAEANGEAACRPGFRGCAFLNAAAEYPADGNVVRAAVERYRAWLHGVVTEALRDLGVETPDDIADQLIMLRDGAMAHGFMGNPESVTSALIAAGSAIVHAHRPLAHSV